jgi:hypothetical protein
MENHTELVLRLAEIGAILLGVALPAWISAIRLRLLFKDFPPHRHIRGGGQILYPKGYEPGDISRRPTGT